MTFYRLVLYVTLCCFFILPQDEQLCAQGLPPSQRHKDSVLAAQYRNLSETCEIAEIPKYVSLMFKTVKPYLASKRINDPLVRHYWGVEATAFNNLGFYFEHTGDNARAMKFLAVAGQIQHELGDEKNYAVTITNLASIYESTGDFKKAIDYYYLALKLREKINDRLGIANIFHALSNLHYSLGKLHEAYVFANKSLQARRLLPDTAGMAFSYENLGIIASEKGDTLAAIDFYTKAAVLYKKMGTTSELAYALIDEARAYHLKDSLYQSKLLYEQAIKLFQQQDQQAKLPAAYCKLSDIEALLHHTDKAIELASLAKSISLATNKILSQSGACYRLSSLYRQKGQFQSAYQNLQEYHQLSDSIKNSNVHNQLLVEEISHEYEKKALQDSIRLEQHRRSFSAALEKQQTRLVFGVVLLLLVMITTVFIYTKYRQITKQNLLIEKQKAELETQKQLADSRLEMAIAQKKVIENSFEKLEETQEHLIAAKMEAEQSSKAKSDFISNVSHEIRTPLNAILGFTELLKERSTDYRHAKYIDNIHQSSEYLLSLVNDLLDLSKIEAGHLKLQNVETNLCELLHECAQMFCHIAKEKRLYLNVICDDHLPELCFIDALRLRQVVYNLLGNAFKFTEQGGVTVVLQFTYANATHSHVDLVLCIEDSGIGIPENQQQLIFEAFKQTEGQDYTKYGGTGLGLAITKKLVQALNGTVEVSSKLAVGSKFCVRIKNVPVVAAHLNELSIGLKPKSILFIESNTSGISKHGIFSNNQINAICVETFADANALLHTTEPDAVVICLPGNSVNLLKQIELYKLAKSKHVLVVMLSEKPEQNIRSLHSKAYDLHYLHNTSTDDLTRLLALIGQQLSVIGKH